MVTVKLDCVVKRLFRHILKEFDDIDDGPNIKLGSKLDEKWSFW